MTHPHSPSRGMMYSTLPTPDEEEEKRPTASEADDALEPVGADADWTGAVPADD